jgi:DNA-binding beta-propeller fold protein YncE
MSNPRRHVTRRRATVRVLPPLCLVALLLGIAAPAPAAPPPLWQACDSSAPAGQRCNFPFGVAVDPGNGHAFVADAANHRMIEFSPG